MELVLPLALRVGLLLYCFIVPGWALLGAAGFTSASKLDRILACLAAGAATTSLTVTTLLLAGVYFRVVTIVLLIAPLAYLVWRGTSTLALNVWWVAIPLYVMEIHAAIGRCVVNRTDRCIGRRCSPCRK